MTEHDTPSAPLAIPCKPLERDPRMGQGKRAGRVGVSAELAPPEHSREPAVPLIVAEHLLALRDLWTGQVAGRAGAEAELVPAEHPRALEALLAANNEPPIGLWPIDYNYQSSQPQGWPA